MPVILSAEVSGAKLTLIKSIVTFSSKLVPLLSILKTSAINPTIKVESNPPLNITAIDVYSSDCIACLTLGILISRYFTDYSSKSFKLNLF